MLSYKVDSETRPANEEKMTATLQSQWQKHAIVLVALIESAAIIASDGLLDMRITFPKDRSKMISQSKIQRKRETSPGFPFWIRL